MSRFSGKCDFCDHIEIWGAQNILNSSVYIGDNIIPLKFETEKDLIPYYPYIIAIAAHDKNGNGFIVLTNESYIDTWEKQLLAWYLEEAKKLYKKCQRKGDDYYGESLKRYDGTYGCKERLEIAKRINEYGLKATAEGLATEFGNYCRGALFEEMVKAGWEKHKAHYWIYKDMDSALKYVGDNT